MSEFASGSPPPCPAAVVPVPVATPPLGGTYLKRSAGVTEDVPPGVATSTSTVPLPAGLIAVTCVSLSTVWLVAAKAPKSTCVAPAKPVPVTITAVPPDSVPSVGASSVTAGAPPA